MASVKSFTPGPLPAYCCTRSSGASAYVRGRTRHVKEPDRNTAAALVQGVLDRNAFLVLTGEQGAGKTAVLGAAVEALSHRGMRIIRVRSPGEGGSGLRRLVGQVLGFVDADTLSDGAIKSVLHLLTTPEGGERQVVLAIDDAQNLTPKALNCLGLLSRVMQTAGAAAPQILLVGRPSLWKALDRGEFSEIRERIGTELTLGKPMRPAGEVRDRPTWRRARWQTAGLALAAIAPGFVLFAVYSQPSSPGNAQTPELGMASAGMQPLIAGNGTPPQSRDAREREPERGSASAAAGIIGVSERGDAARDPGARAEAWRPAGFAFHSERIPLEAGMTERLLRPRPDPRCQNLVVRIQVREEPSDADRSHLGTGCGPDG